MIMDSEKALSRRELADVSGYSYDEILEISKQEGFPIYNKRVYYSEFRKWRREQMEAERRLNIATGQNNQVSHKSYAPNQSHDSLTSLPPEAARLLAQA